MGVSLKVLQRHFINAVARVRVQSNFSVFQFHVQLDYVVQLLIELILYLSNRRQEVAKLKSLEK